MKIRKILFSTSGTGIGGNKEATESLASSILKVIEHENPDKIVFFSTREADETVELVKRLFKEKYNFDPDFEVHHVDPDDFNTCFSKMADIVSAYEGWTMSANYTPGTKTMSAALAAVGALFNMPLIYVSGKREGGVVKRGTETVIMTSPYKFKDAVTLKKIAELFNANMFDSALVETEELTEYPRKDILANVIKGYALWDAFNHDETFEIFDKYHSKDVEFIENFDPTKVFYHRYVTLRTLIE